MSVSNTDLMNQINQALSGVWIPLRLWDHPDLTPAEKFLIVEIDNLCDKDNPCSASNEHLATRLHVSATRLRAMLSNLMKRGYLVRLGSVGQQTLWCAHPDITTSPREVRELMRKYKMFCPEN
jgi:hypothetical protein